MPILQHAWLKIGGNGPGESTLMMWSRWPLRHPAVQRGIRIIRDAENVLAEIA